MSLPQGANQPVSLCSAPGLLSKCCPWGWTVWADCPCRQSAGQLGWCQSQAVGSAPGERFTGQAEPLMLRSFCAPF